MKVIADPETGLILGVGMVGPMASELIAEGTLAVEMGATLEDIMVTIHPHPTLSEAFAEAARRSRPARRCTSTRRARCARVTRILPYEVEDDLVDEARATGRALCRVYRPQEVAVVLGRGGDAARELHLEAIDADDVPVYRRPGGRRRCVVPDPGNVVVTLVLLMAGLGGIRWRSGRLGPGDRRPGGLRRARRGAARRLGPGAGRPSWAARACAANGAWRTTRRRSWWRLTWRSGPLPAASPREPEYRAGRVHGDFVTSLAATGYPYSASSLTTDLYGNLQILLIDLQF
ncbi:MAG: hypothetical protein IPO18_03585 [bacterium]|nr:hypothetical protein [bacterium]